jgi:hypothetical protein
MVFGESNFNPTPSKRDLSALYFKSLNFSASSATLA